MTTITIRNEPLTTGSTVLSVDVTTRDCDNLFLLIPVGNGAADLMTPQEFDRVRVNWKIAKADGAAGQPPDAALGDIRINVGKGEIALTRTDPSTDANFCVLVEDFAPRGVAEAITLELQNSTEDVLASAKFSITDARPKIAEFVSNRYNFRAGEGAQLSWSIAPRGDHRLQRLDDKQVIDAGDQAQGQKTVSQDGTYQLEAMLGDTVTDTRSIRLYSYDQTHPGSVYCGPGDAVAPGTLVCAEILGIYQYAGRPYAVVRDSVDGNRASIWYTERGFDRNSWVPVTPKSGPPVAIPVAAAARPGVVFDDKLYFIGGSSWDADSPATDVGYFHFEAKTWVDGGLKAPRPGDQRRDAPAFPGARMGHGLVTSPDGQLLWVIGGYNGDGGALNDIWVYDKNTQKWEQRPAPKWKQRCLFGATFCETRLWIAGGFDNPGGYPTYSDIWYCDIGDGAWHQLGSSLFDNPDHMSKQYRGCALAAIGDQIYAFVSYDEVDRSGQNKVYKIYPSGDTWKLDELGVASTDWATSRDLVSLDWYRLDATVFGGTIFIRRLARAAIKDQSIRYLALV
jgi:Galactose oxidase, central domain